MSGNILFHYMFTNKNTVVSRKVLDGGFQPHLLCQYRSITLLVLYIIVLTVLALIHCGLNKNLSSGCFIVEAGIISFVLIFCSFLIYYLLTQSKREKDGVNAKGSAAPKDKNGGIDKNITQTNLIPGEEFSREILSKYRWSHLELGSANYGPEGHSDKKAQEGQINQLQPLYTTIDILVREKGLFGTLFLNDLEESACKYTAKLVENYIKGKYPEADIAIKIIAKSYREINVPRDLEVEYLDSIHLKNPDYSQLESDIENPGWINTLLQYSPELMIVSAYCGIHEASIMERCLLQGGEKSEPIESLRYVREANPDPTYLYLHPDGSYNPGWELCTYHYFIRQARQEEFYTQEEMEVRDLKKAEIEKEVCIAREEFILHYEYFKKEVLEHPDFLLLSTFTAHWSPSAFHLNSFVNVLNQWKKEYIVLLRKDNKLDDSKWYKYFFNGKTEGINYRLKEFSMGLTILDMPLKEMSSIENNGSYYMNFLYKIKQGNIDVGKIWGDLNLTEMYESSYPSSTVFWSSNESLKSIYVQLCSQKNSNM